jgi:DNA-directed RNA polymerase specialized sigma24 family protein
VRVHLEDDRRVGNAEVVVHRSGAAEPGPLTVTLIRSAYRELSPEVRETVHLKYREGLSCEAIARAQGVSVSCVKTRLHRGRRDLYAAIDRRVR